MRISDLIGTLTHIQESQGDIDVVLQDGVPHEHPACCKHEQFFVIEEPCDGDESTGMEVVLRTWPY